LAQILHIDFHFSMVLAQNHTIFCKFRSNAILVRICAIVSSEERIKILSTRYLLLSTFSTKKKKVWRTQNDKKWFVRAFPAFLPMFLYWSSLLDIKNRIVVVKLAWLLYAE